MKRQQNSSFPFLIVLFFLLVMTSSFASYIGFADAGAEAYNRGWEKVREEAYQEALDLFEEAAGLAPANGTYRRFIGWVLYSKLGRNEEALPHLRKAAEMIPEEIGVHLDVALAS